MENQCFPLQGQVGMACVVLSSTHKQFQQHPTDFKSVKIKAEIKQPSLLYRKDLYLNTWPLTQLDFHGTFKLSMTSSAHSVVSTAFCSECHQVKRQNTSVVYKFTHMVVNVKSSNSSFHAFSLFCCYLFCIHKGKVTEHNKTQFCTIIIFSIKAKQNKTLKIAIIKYFVIILTIKIWFC